MACIHENNLFDCRLDAAGKERFIKSQMSLANKIALEHWRAFQGPTAKTVQLLEELKSAAYFALCTSAKYFNLVRGNTPTTYAFKAITNGVKSHLRQLRTSGLSGQKIKSKVLKDDCPYTRQFDLLEDDECASFLIPAKSPCDDDYNPDEVAKAKRKVKAALAKLPDRDRRIVILAYWRNMKYQDIGRFVGGVSRQRVKQILERAIEKMRETCLFDRD